MAIHDYYIDKRKNHKNDNYVNIILDYPIEVGDDYYLKVKLCDFKFLNNIYNISSTLMNNQFNIRRYSKTYTYQFGSELYLSDEGFFDDQNALLVSEVIDTDLNSSKITYDDLTLTYYNNTITDNTQSYWKNILSDTVDNTNRKMEVIKDTAFFEFETTNNEKITSLETHFYKDSYTGTPVDVVIAFDRYDTNTDQYVNIESTTLTFQSAGAGETETYTFTYSNPVATGKYRLRCTTASLPFNLYLIKLRANKQIPIFDSGTVDAPVEHTITIPDGFYKASTLKTTLNDLLTNYNLTTSIDQYTNKLKISNDNTAFTPTVDDLIDDNFQLDLVIPNIPNMLENWGITTSYQTYIPVPFNSYYETDTNINLINLSKIIITTDLNFQNKTHNEIITGNSLAKGIGNILCWCDLDIAPFTCLNYRNYEDLSYKIENKHITNIKLSFYNEKSQPLNLDNALIHLQIKKLQKKSLY
jgi:hypothetical protein